MHILPRIRQGSAKARALRAWHKPMTMHMLGITLARLPRFPVIEGQPASRAVHIAPRPAPAGAA